MEEEFKEFEGEGIDDDYEFDAPRFCDFTRSETYWEAEEAEQWFDSAVSYLPSPFVMKVRWGKVISMAIVNGSTQYAAGKSLNAIDDDSGQCIEAQVSEIDEDSRGHEFYKHTIQDTLKVKAKPLSSSTFMKPTASHLAKQKNPGEVRITRIVRRFQNQNSSPADAQATKRQKIEAGYLGKASHLKHQALFTHKTPKKVDPTDAKLASRATVPRQPELETAHRAQRHKSRINADSGRHTTSSSYMFKARPLNRKILEAPSVPFCKKRTPQLPEFHEFHLKTSERALRYTSNDAEGVTDRNSISNCETRNHRIRPNTPYASRQQKSPIVNKLKCSPYDKRLLSKGERGVFQNIRQENVFSMELKITNDKRYLKEPPTELFSKLSLASEPQQTTKYQLEVQPIFKGLKENRPGSFDHEHERTNLAKEGMLRIWEKQYQFMNYDMYKLQQNVPQFCGSS